MYYMYLIHGTSIVLLFLSFIALIVFVSISYLRHFVNKTVDLPEPTNPAIVWYHRRDEIFWVPASPTIYFPTTKKGVVKCDVFSKTEQPVNTSGFLFYASYLNDFPLPRTGELWGLYHEESPRNMPQLLQPAALALFNFSATFSRYSDVPFPVVHAKSLKAIVDTTYFIGTQTKNQYLADIAPVLYIQTNCDTMNDRDEFVKQLMEHIAVDSYGNCLRNKLLPGVWANMDRKKYLHLLNHNFFLSFVSKYKFVIAIENGICNDYMTEKLWRPIEIGVVPIYFGSPTVREWLPNEKSAILVEEFETPAQLAEHLHLLLRNDTLYDQYLLHKTKSLITNKKLIDEFEKRPYQHSVTSVINKLICVMCERIHENSNRTNIVSKKHYDCPVRQLSVLSHSFNSTNRWHDIIDWAKHTVEHLYRDYVYNKSIPKGNKLINWKLL